MSGERQGDREALDRLTRDVLDTPRKDRPFSEREARDMARNAMREVDRKLRETGER